MTSKKFPSFSQWKQVFKTLRGIERKIFIVFIIFAVISGLYLLIGLYINNTELAPAYGGVYIEGVVGQPRFINPIYGETNDIDRSLIDLVYSGLMTYDRNGNLITDLAENYNISDNGKIYSFQLKKDLYWQDGIKLTVDDVIYTIKTIQNSDYKSPLRADWLNVIAEKTSENSLTLTLNSPYNSFLENCTLKIIPQHIWKNILPENFALSPYNLQPIGSGPYIPSAIQETTTGFIRGITLTINTKYYDKIPFLSEINFKFFANKEELISAANQKSINGFSVIDSGNNEALTEKQVKQGWFSNGKFNVYSFSLPRYFAVFFNTQNTKILSNSYITQALNHSVNKQELGEKIADSFKEKLTIINSPILSEYFGYNSPTVNYDFNTETANKLLDKSGYKISETTGVREKANTKTPAFQFKSYLSVGSKNNEVVELQGCLARLDENFKNLLTEETSGKYGKGTENAVTAFQKKYLPDVPSTGEVGTGTRKKLNELCLTPQKTSIPLQFTITTINQPQLVSTANLLKDYWQKVGIVVNVNAVELSDIKTIIKNRDYDALLYGQALGGLPDLYPFWHSTQINDPGLNISAYQNKTADQLLKDAREALNEETKKERYEKLQNTILTDAPALFLYNPDYLYWVSDKINGIETTKIVDPAKRFENIQNWYIKTKRVWK